MTARPRILIGVDLNVPGHGWLAARAAPFALRTQAQVDVIYVGEATDSGRKRLEEHLRQDFVDEIRGEALMRAGKAEEVLVELSADYDVLVVGPREPGALERMLKGTMAQRVLRGARCPVLVPRSAGPTDRPWRVLAGLDLNGPHRQRVLTDAGRWAARLGGGKVDGVYAMAESLPPIKRKDVRALAEKEWAASREPVRQSIATMMADCVPEEVRGEALVRRGEAEDVLATMSADYDLIVVGNRSRAGLGRLLLGTVAQNVVRSAHCDVLTLPTAQYELAG